MGQYQFILDVRGLSWIAISGMVKEKRYIKQIFKFFDARRFWSRPGVSEVLFIAVGVIITLAAYWTMNISVQGMIRHEYDRMTQNTVRILVGGLQELERSAENMAAMMSLSNEVDRGLIFEKIREPGPHLEHFDQIVWIYEESPGRWKFKNILAQKDKETNFSKFSIKSGSDFLSYLIEKKQIFQDEKLNVLIDPGLFNLRYQGMQSLAQIHPFALMKAIKAGDSSAGLLVGIGSGASILDETWLKNNEVVSGIGVREVNSGVSIFELKKPGVREDVWEDVSQTYEFSFGNKKWEISIEYSKEDKVYFLEAMPFFMALFGFLLTALGTLYVHNNQKQAMRTAIMNKALEQKNRELEFQVTERERLNEVLFRSERDNRAIIDSVSDIIFETDTQGKILFLSAAWQKITNFDPEQSKGLELIKMLHPQDQEKQLKDFQLLVRGQKEAYRSFTRLRTAQGTFRAVELAISMIRRNENKDLRVVGTITDVEERRRAERALGEAEKKYRNIVENAAGGFFQLTPEGLYLSANPALARILGYDSPEDLLHNIKDANETVYLSYRLRQGVLRELDETGAVHNHEVQVYRKDRSVIWVNENIRLVKDDSGNLLYYEGSMEDITRRKQSDLALREAKIHSDLANRAKSEFLANMSHELRTPLNAIIGFSEIIKNEVFGKIEQEAYKEYAKDINKSGQKLLKVINEILDISKIEAGERQLNEKLIDIGLLVKSNVELLEAKARANKLSITNTLQDTPKIVAEELAVKQIIANLLSNAVKFTPNGGRVTISSDIDREGRFRISFTDTGIGLDEAEIEKALSPFGQVDNAMSRANAGTGLGLTLVDALIKLHGGRLELFSEKGIGTTATVVFPASRVKKIEAPKIAEEGGEAQTEKV